MLGIVSLLLQYSIVTFSSNPYLILTWIKVIGGVEYVVFCALIIFLAGFLLIIKTKGALLKTMLQLAFSNIATNKSQEVCFRLINTGSSIAKSCYKKVKEKSKIRGVTFLQSHYTNFLFKLQAITLLYRLNLKSGVFGKSNVNHNSEECCLYIVCMIIDFIERVLFKRTSMFMY